MNCHKIVLEDNILFICTEGLANESYPSHRHSDLNSFVLYKKGVPIFIDPGRLNYVIEDK